MNPFEQTLEDPKNGRVVGDADCMRITRPNGESLAVGWSEIVEVHAYKRDLLTTDLICLLFKSAGPNGDIEIHEEMAGYHDLLESLLSHLPSFTLEWFRAVAFPAFDTNFTIIWKKP